jgi:hypothetical protein
MLEVALVGMVAPLLALSAQKGTRMGLGSSNVAINTTERYELTNEGSHVGATQGVVYIDPCCA